MEFFNFKFNMDWTENKKLHEDWSKNALIFREELAKLEKAILPDETLVPSLGSAKVIQNSRGKFQIVFLFEYLPQSLADRFKDHIVFKAEFLDPRTASYSLMSPMRRLGDW
jgi:hypothetical protein